MAGGVASQAEFDLLEAVWRRHTDHTAHPADHPAPHDPLRNYPELRCVADRFALASLTAAADRAGKVGVSADRVLVSSGAISDEDYVRALAERLDIAFDALALTPRNWCPLDDSRLIEAIPAGIVPLRIGGELVYVVAPRGIAARRLTELSAGDPRWRKRIRLTTSEHLKRFVERHSADAIGARATDLLRTAMPQMSAAPRQRQTFRWKAALVAALTAAAIAIQPHTSMTAIEALLALMFIAWIVMRLVGAMMRLPGERRQVRIPDDTLPVYTIMVALYREASSVDGLIAAIRGLDYPAEKLDVKFVIEPDDEDTHAALLRAQLSAPFEIVVAPAVGPKTKPKALNAALPFARGSFLVIYDAEDRPESDQLRRALGVFRRNGDALACVQACLTIDNTGDNWLSAMFTAEYAGQFDVFLPALAALNLPLPLGGSSNHFRTAALRKVGGWDPYNVTEDADLGMRLARFGYRSDVIDAATYEEAPARLRPWLRQRTRWFKGWLLTWAVHMREPRRLARDLGLPGFIAFQLMVGGNVLAALVHPIFIGVLAVSIWRNGGWPHDQLTTALFGISVAVGYLTSVLLGAIGLVRRRLIGAAWALPLIPLHWLLLSTAAWRALFQLIADPYRWEKTDHGFARTSRLARRKRADRIIATILEGAGAKIRPARSISAGRRPPAREAASY
ncbi:glycosyltransferase family 2 protein [Pseudolabrys sp.]|uniref:glycosyltransferase family 2 protein n=1 Tax=Pseudolabrys sp. TaxID=1960880 RepID=UPI003D0E26A1